MVGVAILLTTCFCNFMGVGANIALGELVRPLLRISPSIITGRIVGLVCCFTIGLYLFLSFNTFLSWFDHYWQNIESIFLTWSDNY